MTPSRRLLHYFSRYRGSLLIGALCVIGSSVFSLAKPLIVGNAVNALAKELTRGTLLHFGGLLIAASIIQGIFLFLQRRIVIGVSRRIEYDIRNDFYQHLQRLPAPFYTENRTGDLMSRATNDLSSVRMLIGPAVMHSFSSLLVVVGAFVMMARIDTRLALLALGAVPVIAGSVYYFGERIHLKFKGVQEYFGEISSRVQENLAGVRVIRAFVQESHEDERFKEMNHEFVDRNRSLIKLTAVFYPLLHCIIGLLFVLVFFIGSKKIMAGSMTIGSYVAFQFYLGRMVWPLIALGWVINLFQRGMASMVRLNEVWTAEPESEILTATECDVPALGGSIEIRHLNFSYATVPVLTDINVSIADGETIGIVGRTGSGKSTLLAVIARLYEPPPGTIFVGGCPVESVPKSRLRGMIGVVPQETFLFSEEIAENIRFGRREASLDEVESVAALAGLSGDIGSFPNGLETVVGERGITLSGGQKQRTAIARAILRNPAILMLDDALSAVDTGTEERILRALRTVRQGRTVLIVSHRVSSVKDADQILVLDRGRIVEKGTHEQLLDRDGYYAGLYRKQTLEEEIEEIA